MFSKIEDAFSVKRYSELTEYEKECICNAMSKHVASLAVLRIKNLPDEQKNITRKNAKALYDAAVGYFLYPRNK